MEITNIQLEKIRKQIDYCQDKELYQIDELEGLLELIINIFGTEKQKEK